MVPPEGECIELQTRAILNPGSVGQPRDHDPRASYAIFHPEKNGWEIHRIEYDIRSVQKRIRAAELPMRHALRLTRAGKATRTETVCGTIHVWLSANTSAMKAFATGTFRIVFRHYNNPIDYEPLKARLFQ